MHSGYLSGHCTARVSSVINMIPELLILPRRGETGDE